MPIEVPDGALVWNDTFEAKYVTRYLENYVDKHVYDGISLRERFKFNSPVENIYKSGDLWIVKANECGRPVTFTSRKLIITTGLLSEEDMPSIPGSDSFSGHLYHHKYIGRTDLINNPDVNNVTILGGGKSAADLVYAFAKAGKNVSWVIRTTGSGAPILAPPEGVGECLNRAEETMTRLLGIFSPSPFATRSWLEWFIHSTWLGEYLLRSIFASVERTIATAAAYTTRSDALPGFSSLAPDSASVRWQIGNIGMITHPDFWNVVARNVHVHRASITRLHGRTAVLSTGAELRTDLLVACTGYTSTLPFLPSELKAQLGLPCPSSAVAATELAHWTGLESRADAAVLARFPVLAHSPTAPSSHTATDATQPYRLYRGILSPSTPSLILVGHVLHGNHFQSAEIQSLWGVAALSGRLALPSREAMDENIAAFVAWNRRRYPAHAEKANSVIYEGMGYVDALLAEMGLSGHRGKGWWGDVARPTLPRDLSGLLEEWRENCRVRGVDVAGDL